MDVEYFKLVREFGLALGVFGVFVFQLKWMLKTSAEQLHLLHQERDKMHDERVKFLEALERRDGACATHSRNVAEFSAAVTEAHRYQREEHKEMIQILGRINGYKHD